MSDVWMRSVEQRLTSQKAGGRALHTQLASLKGQIGGLQDAVERLARQALAQVETFDAEMAQLLEMQDDPTVLVRDYGSNRLVYHSANRPCGWVKERRRYRELLLGQAKSEGKAPCSSCGYYAQRAANPIPT